ncbi:MAG: hypothetical protein LBM92_04065 [Opitutaceae bacterium]|jgi:hypothetical protein|nr:hypothetical protein [Opitutaceae bacterium]
MNTSPILQTETPDATPDSGPVRRGGLRVAFYSILALFLGVASAAALFARPSDAQLARQISVYAWIPAIVFLGLAARGFWCMISAWRGTRRDAPYSHSVLAGELGFDLLCTCRDVVAAAFFLPDSTRRGGVMRMLVFLENYSSRHRVVNLRLGHLAGIGRPEATITRLRLAAGQAAVYCLPVRALPGITPGNHHLSVRLWMECPSGAGQRLPGSRRHMFDARKIRIAAPFDVAEDAAPSSEADAPLPAARYISLASVSEPTPRMSKLHAIVEESAPRIPPAA